MITRTIPPTSLSPTVFDALRDPTRFNLRYETVWFNELLLCGSVVAGRGARLLSQHISQQEIFAPSSKETALACSASFEYRSDGQFREFGLPIRDDWQQRLVARSGLPAQ